MIVMTWHLVTRPTDSEDGANALFPYLCPSSESKNVWICLRVRTSEPFPRRDKYAPMTNVCQIFQVWNPGLSGLDSLLVLFGVSVAMWVERGSSLQIPATLVCGAVQPNGWPTGLMRGNKPALLTV